jgi:ElaB/YqjD/DUF883 family membrane-anchored ribosome-binding protein
MRNDEWRGIARARPVSFTTERLIAQVKALVYDAEILLRATADEAGERIAAARARTEVSLRRAREDAAAAGQELVQHARAATAATDRYVRTNPWQAAGIAVGVGFLLGRLTLTLSRERYHER